MAAFRNKIFRHNQTAGILSFSGFLLFLFSAHTVPRAEHLVYCLLAVVLLLTRHPLYPHIPLFLSNALLLSSLCRPFPQGCVFASFSAFSPFVV